MLGLHQGDYRLNVDSLDNMQKVLLRFRCSRGQTARFKVSPPSVASDLREQLLDHGLIFDSRDYFDEYRNVVGQHFEVEGDIPVRLRVEADIEHTRIHVYITNFDAPISRHAEYQPEQITSELLDDLGNFILRKSAKLIQLPISEEERQDLRQRIEREAHLRDGGLISSLLGRKKG